MEGFKQQLADELALEPVDDLVELEEIVEEEEGDEEWETPIRDCQEKIKKKEEKEKEKEEEIKEKEKKLGKKWKIVCTKHGPFCLFYLVVIFFSFLKKLSILLQVMWWGSGFNESLRI